MAELLVATTLLVVVLMPIAYAIVWDLRTARSCYDRAVAMEIVDGEMEILAAGEWRTFSPGAREYPVHSLAAANLPPGRFLLTVQTNLVRLEWQPDWKAHGGAVVRETLVK